MDTIKQQTLKFQKARSNLLLVVAFSAVNLLLAAFNSNIYLLFSATAPLFVFEIGQGAAEESQSSAFLVTGLIIAFFVIALYFICWIFAKRLRAFILAALIFFSIDTLIFIFIAFAAGFEISYLLDIVFHGWILFYLIKGTAAWAKLRGVNADDFNFALQKTDAAPATRSCGDFLIEPPADGAQQNEFADHVTSPLRADDKKGRVLISANYEGLQISMKRTRGLTELIVDGYVYDEIKGTVEVEYSLTANLQDKKIVGMYRSHMFLYVNDVLAAKKLRLY
ncbi:MAG: hypothetical protein FWF05_00385 [Oscillospiraceae bacterium]|nr:hypothetical protein [Oscillospiraceae bacterium]